MTDYPRRPSGCDECDTQDVPWPAISEREARDLHRAAHELGRALLPPARWLLKKLGGFA